MVVIAAHLNPGVILLATLHVMLGMPFPILQPPGILIPLSTSSGISGNLALKSIVRRVRVTGRTCMRACVCVRWREPVVTTVLSNLVLSVELFGLC